MQHLQAQLARAGYLSLWQKVDAKQYSCQSRPRIYLLAFYCKSLEHASVEGPVDTEVLEQAIQRSWLPQAFLTLQTLAGESFPLDKYLLPDSHEEIREWKAHRMAVKTQAESKKDSRTPPDLSFEAQHLEFYNMEGLQWPPTPAMIEAAGLAGRVEHLPADLWRRLTTTP